MLSCAMLDRIRDPFDQIVEMGPAGHLDLNGQVGRDGVLQRRQAPTQKGTRRRAVEDFVRFQARRPVEQRLREDLGDRLERDTAAIKVEALLLRLARHRTGHDDINAAASEDELQRIRRFVELAHQARGQIIHSRRQTTDKVIDVAADAMVEGGGQYGTAARPTGKRALGGHRPKPLQHVVLQSRPAKR